MYVLLWIFTFLFKTTPANTKRNKHVIIASKRRFDVILHVYYVVSIHRGIWSFNIQVYFVSSKPFCDLRWFITHFFLIYLGSLSLKNILESYYGYSFLSYSQRAKHLQRTTKDLIWILEAHHILYSRDQKPLRVISWVLGLNQYKDVIFPV